MSEYVMGSDPKAIAREWLYGNHETSSHLVATDLARAILSQSTRIRELEAALGEALDMWADEVGFDDIVNADDNYERLRKLLPEKP